MKCTSCGRAFVNRPIVAVASGGYVPPNQGACECGNGTFVGTFTAGPTQAQIDEAARTTSPGTVERWRAWDRLYRSDATERTDALAGVVRRLLQWDQMNPPMTGDHAYWKSELTEALGASRPSHDA